MAIIFEKHDPAGRKIQVRTAGRTRRLYVDGVLHSQYNPQRPFTSDIWDAIALGGLAVSRQPMDRVLLMGLGGGSAVHLLRQHLAPTYIAAVELDREKIRLGAEYFDLHQDPGFEVFATDAQAWLSNYRGAAFDFIIDDLFHEVNGQPERAVPCDAPWLERILQNLAPRGAVAVNFGSVEELGESAVLDATTRRHFPYGCKVALPTSENAIAVLARDPLDPARLRGRIQALPAMQLASNRRHLRLSIRDLW